MRSRKISGSTWKGAKDTSILYETCSTSFDAFRVCYFLKILFIYCFVLGVVDVQYYMSLVYDIMIQNIQSYTPFIVIIEY